MVTYVHGNIPLGVFSQLHSTEIISLCPKSLAFLGSAFYRHPAAQTLSPFPPSTPAQYLESVISIGLAVLGILS
jgi:hypothetical protein